MLATHWTYVAACLVVPVAWGLAVHVLFERFGSRHSGSRRRGSGAGPGGRAETPSVGGERGDPDDDLAPEYQI